MQDDNKKKFKITMSLHQKYHMLRLAEGLIKSGNLDKIYSPYPKRMITPFYGISANYLNSFRLIGALRFLFYKLKQKFLDEETVFLFDKLVAMSLKKASVGDFFHGLNLSCEYSLKAAKKKRFITFVERACPHIDYQEKLLNEEYRLLSAPPEQKPLRKRKIGRMKREYDSADYIVVPSEYSLRSFIELGVPREKILVVPLSFENVVSRPAARNYDKLKFFCLGGNFYRKGIFYLLKAWEKLNLKNAELIIKTGGIPEPFLKFTKKKNITVINKYLSRGELENLYQSVHVFVLPSIDEGFGMAAAEAMSCGLPVIVTENVGMADGIKDGVSGFVIPIRDVGAIAEKIKFFYDNPEKIKEMGENAFKQSSFFTHENYVKRMITAYESVL